MAKSKESSKVEAYPNLWSYCTEKFGTQFKGPMNDEG